MAKSDGLATSALTSSRFNLIELRKIYDQLVENKNITEENQNLVIEILRVIAEIVVYGDNKSELLFDFFCEKNMLALFLEIMWSDIRTNPVNVFIQILQTLSILISCVKNDTSLYYLLSNNYINQILMYPYHKYSSTYNSLTNTPTSSNSSSFSSSSLPSSQNTSLLMDEALIPHFASFIKSLSIRLNNQTIQFFFNDDNITFPLLIKAIELINSKDQMIRISAQTTILNILQINDEKSRKFSLTKINIHNLFQSFNKIMLNQLETIETYTMNYIKACKNKSLSSKEKDIAIIKAEQIYDDYIIIIEDWFFYLQDLLSLNIKLIELPLIDFLCNHFLMKNVFSLYIQIYNELSPSASISSSSSFSSNDPNSSSQSSINSQNSEGNNSKEDDAGIETLMIRAGCVSFYLLKMIRIVSNPLLKQSLLSYIMHPFSVSSRSLYNKKISHDDFSPLINDTNPTLASLRDSIQFLILQKDHRLSLLLLFIQFSLISYQNDSEELVNPFLKSKSLTKDEENEEKKKLNDLNLTKYVSLLDDSLKQQEKINYLKSIYFFNFNKEEKFEEKNIISEKHYETEAQLVNLSHIENSDLLNLENIQKIYSSVLLPFLQSTSTPSSPFSTPAPGISFFLNMLRNPDDSCLTSLQVATNIIYETIVLLHPPIVIKVPSYVNYDDDYDDYEGGSQENIGVNNDLSNLKEKKDEIKNEIIEEEESDEAFNLRLDQLYYLRKELYNICTKHAKGLSLKAHSLMSEVLLVLINEELKRIQGRRWRSTFSKMVNDRSYMFPTIPLYSPIPTSIEYEIPVSQVELMRRQVQIFLMSLALFKYVEKVIDLSVSFEDNSNNEPASDSCTVDSTIDSESSDKSVIADTSITSLTKSSGKKRKYYKELTEDRPTMASVGLGEDLLGDFFSIIDEEALWAFDEDHILPEDVLSKGGAGGTGGGGFTENYNMKGKKFLDAIHYTTQEVHQEVQPVEPDVRKGILSIFSGRRRSSSHTSHTNSPSNSSNTATSAPVITEVKASKLLIVNDPDVFLLIKPNKVDTKVNFAVKVAAPLFYTDAKIDLEDKRNITIIIRSWREQNDMVKAEPDIDFDAPTPHINSPISSSSAFVSNNTMNTPMNSGGCLVSRFRKKKDSFLLPVDHNIIYQITLTMENESLAALVAKHIETRRLALSSEKLNNLIQYLEQWKLQDD